MSTIEEVLDYWFGAPAQNDADVMAQVKRWFAGGPSMDAEVQERFGATVEDALVGKLESWAATPRGRVALVILLDQFTRNLFRGKAKTYDGDPKAQRLALEAFDQGLEKELTYVEKQFLAMPLLHSENLSLQRRSAALAQELATEAPPLYAKLAGMGLEQSQKYLTIVERFGRFPHRNALLGRTSTPEEETFLVDWESRQPPTGAPRP